METPCDNCTPQPNKLINVDEKNMCVSCGKVVKIKYKPEYLEIAKNSKSLVELSQKIGVEIQTIMAWANKKKKDEQGNRTEELARPEFMLIVSELFKAKPEEKPKHAGGRPTKYRPEFVNIAKGYIETCSRENTELPTIEGLALLLEVDDERISEYSALYPEFHATIKALKAKQKAQLMNDGMYGGKEVNSTMAIFLLKVNHGLVETQNIDHRTLGKELPTPIMNGQTLHVPTDNSNEQTA